MEIVLPGDMTVRESHDIALALQHKIESLSDVERAFVHVCLLFSCAMFGATFCPLSTALQCCSLSPIQVDHQERDGLEHKVERVLVKGAGALNPHAPVDSTTITPLTDDAVKTSADIEMVIVDGSRRGWGWSSDIYSIAAKRFLFLSRLILLSPTWRQTSKVLWISLPARCWECVSRCG